MVVIILSASSVSMFFHFNLLYLYIKTIVQIVKMILETTNVYHWQNYVLKMKQKLLFDPLTNSIPRMVLPLLFFFRRGGGGSCTQKGGELICSAAGAGWR